MQTLCGTEIPHPGTKHAFTENGTCQGKITNSQIKKDVV